MKVLVGLCLVVALLTGGGLRPVAGQLAPAAFQTLHVGGSFNDWNPSDPAYQMKPTSNQVWRLEKVFRPGQYAFKFVFDGSFDKSWGLGAGEVLTQPGANIPLTIKTGGAYAIDLDWPARKWSLIQLDLEEPQAFVTVVPPVEVGLPVTLDASDSVARKDHEIREYTFGQDMSDDARVSWAKRDPDTPRALLHVPQAGMYHLWVMVDDGMPSKRTRLNLEVRDSFQLVGDWTGIDPKAPKTFMQRLSPTVHEKILKSTAPGEAQLIVVKNHDTGQLVANLAVSVTQTNQQHWRARYDEEKRELTCVPEDLIEFVFRPRDYPQLKDKGVQVKTVHLAAPFNDWNPTSTPLTAMADGTFATYLRLEAAPPQYKYVVNGLITLPGTPGEEPTPAPGAPGTPAAPETAASYGPVPANDINLKAVLHRPEQMRYFNIASSELVQLTVRTLAGDATQVRLHLTEDAPAAGATNAPAVVTLPMRRAERTFGFDYWQSNVFIDPSKKRATYFFSLTDGTVSRFYGAAVDPAKPQGVTPFATELVSAFPTPEWAKHVVWYQIIPDRFRNGSVQNDPPKPVPWRSYWYKLQPGEQPMREGMAGLSEKDWPNKLFSNDWYQRRYGGDLQGIIDKLPYLRDLGVGALYLAPAFEAASYHGYDVIDHRHVSQFLGVKGDTTELTGKETLDRTTWKWTPSDKVFLELIQKAHAAGIRVIMDLTFGFVSKSSFAFQDVMINRAASAYADWFDVTAWSPIRYDAVDAKGNLPRLRRDAEKGLASDTARQYAFDVTKRWMDPNGDGDPSDGVDGWRLYGTENIGQPFWVAWRKHVKSINPSAYIAGELWRPMPGQFQGDQLDGALNYQFAIRAMRYFIDRRRRLSTTEFDRQLHELLELYPLQVNMVLQNLYDSHETDRLAGMIANPDHGYNQNNRTQDQITAAAQAAAALAGLAGVGPSFIPYNGDKPDDDAYTIMKLMATFQMTFVGAPMIWYGDETGMFGSDDPNCRKPMLWKDLGAYDHQSDVVMTDLFEHYRRLGAIRSKYQALRTGLFETLLTNDADSLYGFARIRRDEVVAVFLNSGGQDQAADLPVPFPSGSRVMDVLHPQTPMYVVREGKVRLNLPRKSACILVLQ